MTTSTSVIGLTSLWRSYIINKYWLVSQWETYLLKTEKRSKQRVMDPLSLSCLLKGVKSERLPCLCFGKLGYNMFIWPNIDEALNLLTTQFVLDLPLLQQCHKPFLIPECKSQPTTAAGLIQKYRNTFLWIWFRSETCFLTTNKP